MRILTLGALALLAGCNEPAEPPRELRSGTTVSGHFGPEGTISEDVSGLACDWQRGGDSMRCLAIEDEGDSAQWTSFNGTVLAAGQRFGLREGGAPLGSAPRDICDEYDPESREVDGEAAAYSDGVFYVTGSHGCARNSNDFRPASFIVARIAPDEPRGPIVPGTVALTTSHRLARLMQQDETLAPYFGASLYDANGLNIEGLAVDGDRMIFGLRAPSIEGHAYLFETSATALFSRQIVGSGRSLTVPLGRDTGIRDLAFLPDGRLLILSGPAQDQDVAYRIHLRTNDGAVSTLETLSPAGNSKPEALAIVGLQGRVLSLLILFDSAADGAPEPLTLRLPR
ncbi:DUF3616 domain-containing protein [Parasphingopyxis lamellibrachiae]|uniref:Uncharacterized protein DUF3616 n=1 Tax=Parasphingopyxis lamellibrachiae TaxID=680125 RepID=A0A3D9FGG5_9SPHN|nr:DUF3616 domain-containing protein [Parasphingopyxis lamellibrachiae]RED16905.1 uncharacterized protein DUF3616 [Parasphingopyxis lamellibrachiae]